MDKTKEIITKLTKIKYFFIDFNSLIKKCETFNNKTEEQLKKELEDKTKKFMKFYSENLRECKYEIRNKMNKNADNENIKRNRIYIENVIEPFYTETGYLPKGISSGGGINEILKKIEQIKKAIDETKEKINKCDIKSGKNKKIILSNRIKNIDNEYDKFKKHLEKCKKISKKIDIIINDKTKSIFRFDDL